MEFVEPEGEPSPYRPPPPPDDRLWRHPSELGPAGGDRHGRSPGSPRPVWVVAGFSALLASVLSSGLVIAVAATRWGSSGSGGVVERQMVRPRPAATVQSWSAVDITERLRPAIVQLEVALGGGSGTASGVVFRSDGFVLTNAHVVAGATSITASMSSGRRLAARLVGTDPETDTAVLKLDGGPFSVATLGTSVDLRVGQPAVALGFPLGLAGGPSVTGGMVSALHQDVVPVGATTALADMIQTDAPVSPGSSGGALVDANGAVIGITTAVVSGAAGDESAGFATPIDTAHSVAEDLIRSGRVVHVWLGVDGADLDQVTASDLDLDGGAVVGDVEASSPAERAGVAPLDVIVALSGRPVRSVAEMLAALRAHRPGDRVAIEIVRNGARRTLTATLGQRPPPS